MISNSLLKLLLLSKAMVDRIFRSWTFDLRMAMIWKAKFLARSASRFLANAAPKNRFKSWRLTGCGLPGSTIPLDASVSPEEYWESVLRDPRAAGKPWLPLQQMRLSEIPTGPPLRLTAHRSTYR